LTQNSRFYHGSFAVVGGRRRACYASGVLSTEISSRSNSCRLNRRWWVVVAEIRETERETERERERARERERERERKPRNWKNKPICNPN
jgi:hypothetical protein